MLYQASSVDFSISTTWKEGICSVFHLSSFRWSFFVKRSLHRFFLFDTSPDRFTISHSPRSRSTKWKPPELPLPRSNPRWDYDDRRLERSFLRSLPRQDRMQLESRSVIMLKNPGGRRVPRQRGRSQGRGGCSVCGGKGFDWIRHVQGVLGSLGHGKRLGGGWQWNWRPGRPLEARRVTLCLPAFLKLAVRWWFTFTIV
jgi:hypothetical protein